MHVSHIGHQQTLRDKLAPPPGSAPCCSARLALLSPPSPGRSAGAVSGRRGRAVRGQVLLGGGSDLGSVGAVALSHLVGLVLGALASGRVAHGGVGRLRGDGRSRRLETGSRGKTSAQIF